MFRLSESCLKRSFDRIIHLTFFLPLEKLFNNLLLVGPYFGLLYDSDTTSTTLVSTVGEKSKCPVPSVFPNMSSQSASKPSIKIEIL